MNIEKISSRSQNGHFNSDGPLDGSGALEAAEVLRVPFWADLSWLRHGFSTRLGGLSQIAGAARASGDLNLGYSAADDPATVALNRARFLREIEAPPDKQDGCGLVTLKQMHSSLVRRVGASDVADRASLWGDGLITDDAGVLLGIQTADCLPILIVDRGRRAVGAFHAGWRGTYKRIAERGVAAMVAEFGSDPSDLTAAIGPGIGRCCFAVGREVRDLFVAAFPYADQLFLEGQTLNLDLVEANRRQLLRAGLRPDAVCVLNECTSCNVNRFFSYRAERGKTGRMLSVIGIAPAWSHTF